MWSVEEFPLQPQEELRLRRVDDATLTPFATGRLRQAWGQPSRYVQGAVYDRLGNLVPASQRLGGFRHDHAVQGDPDRLPSLTTPPRELSGTWLYGGHWMNHFGHFLTETVTTLWPRRQIDGVVFHRFWFGAEAREWQRDALRLLDLPSEPVVVDDQAVTVERLLVPTRPFVPNGYVLPAALEVWKRMRMASEPWLYGSTQRIFLSRSRFNPLRASQGRSARRGASNDEHLDQLFADRGYLVMHPQDIPLPQQIAVVAGARLLAGSSGSALHLSVFADPGCRVLEVGDARGSKRPVLTQRILTHALGQRLDFLSFQPDRSPDAGGPRAHDLAKVSRKLDRLGA